MKNLIGMILLMSTVAAHAIAQEGGHLDVRTLVQKEEVTVNEAGEADTHLVAADTVIPGDRVVYTITFENISNDAAENVVITNPIADSLTYVDGSAFGPGTDIQFSVDGGQSFAAREALTVAENGDVRPAEAKDFTHIRWVMKQDLPVGAQGMARFSADLK